MSWGQVVNRLLQTVTVVIGVTVIVFSLMHLTPGDPVEIMMENSGFVEPGEIQRLRHEMGLDRPLPVQYLAFLSGIVRGDLGVSMTTRRPVREMIASRLPATVELTLAAILVSLVIALPVGVISAVRRYSVLDKVGTVSALFGVSTPDFWLGLVLIVIFSVGLGWLPTAGRIDYGFAPPPITGLYVLDSLLTGNRAALGNALRHLAMPALTVGTAMAALTMRVTRSSMLEVVRQDYVTFARSKGLSEAAVVIHHALRNALIPTLTVVALNMGVLLGGNMVVESVFGWPGLGRLVVQSIFYRDYPVVQGAVLVYALTYVTLNFLADVAYVVINPRVRF